MNFANEVSNTVLNLMYLLAKPSFFAPSWIANKKREENTKESKSYFAAIFI